MVSKASRIRALMADSGCSRAEAKAWIELEGDDEPAPALYTPCEHCSDELPPEACAARRGVSEVPCLTFTSDTQKVQS